MTSFYGRQGIKEVRKWAGLYIVSLNNSEPISVNVNDSRIAHKAIKVTKANCKFGKAKNLNARKKNYFKTFGEQNVNFMPVALIEDITHAEKAVLARLDHYRMRGRTGRKNEWLEGISSQDVLQIVLETLDELGISYEKWIERRPCKANLLHVFVQITYRQTSFTSLILIF